MENLIIFSPVFAYLLDCLLGEPKPALHPVCHLGNMAALLEKQYLNKCHSAAQKFLCGICCCIVLCIVFAVLPLLFFLVLKKYCLLARPDAYPLLGFVFCSVMLYLCIAPDSLTKHIQFVQEELKKGNIAEARRKLSWIVGRNTQKMDEADIIRASIESLAENSVDSTIASYFWFCAGYTLFSFEGAILLTVLHRIFNTLDAMWGKKNERYLYFGKFAARTDDVLNFLPARISFYLIILCCFFIKGCDAGNAWSIGKKYRNKHASPNSAWAEAPYAGALHLKLAGPVRYGEFFCDYPYLGEGTLLAEQKHLVLALKIFHCTVFAAVFACTIWIAAV